MAYQGRQPGVGVRNRFIYTATASQTTFSGTDSNGLTLAYQDGAYVDVYLNGVLLIPVTDYTSTTKTSVTLTTGATSGDAVEILCYDIASIADTVSKSSGGTFDGAVTVAGNFSGGTIAGRLSCWCTTWRWVILRWISWTGTTPVGNTTGYSNNRGGCRKQWVVHTKHFWH
jgi:hypothetical protein